MAITLEEKQLAQITPSSTSATELYTPTEHQKVIITNLTISNTTAASETFCLFHDNDGTTYDERTALAWRVPVAPATLYSISKPGWCLSAGSAGSFAVESSRGDALTYTLYGLIIRDE